MPNTEASPIRKTRDMINFYKIYEIAVEGRINYLNNKDTNIQKQIDKARMFVQKKKITQQSRKMHELLIGQNYSQKIEEIAQQQAHVE